MTEPKRKLWGALAILVCLPGLVTVSLAQDQEEEHEEQLEKDQKKLEKEQEKQEKEAAKEQEKALDEEEKEKKRAKSYDGNWELGVFVPYSAFDTNVPIRDLRGVDDEIRDTYGRGFDLAYNFTRHHAIETNNSWVDSDSEDQRGAIHFSVRTRYNLLNYRYTMWWGQRWAPFLMVGAGAFRARVLEEDHESFGGRVTTAGAGLRYFLSHRSSTFFMVEGARVMLNPEDATNVVFMWGISAHIGKGPGSFDPPPKPAD